MTAAANIADDLLSFGVSLARVEFQSEQPVNFTFAEQQMTDDELVQVIEDSDDKIARRKALKVLRLREFSAGAQGLSQMMTEILK